MANDLGDSHPLSLQQGGALPDSSTDLRTAGKIWSAVGQQVTVDLFPEVDTISYTVELYSHTDNFLAWKSITGNGTITYTPQSENWLVIKVRNTTATTPGQKIYVKATYTAPQVLNLADVPLSQTITVNTKVFLQGAYDSGSGEMTTWLKDLGFLPLSQPFNAAPWNYTGTESVSEIPADVSDWVLVELRRTSEAAGLFAQQAAFLKKDGSIVSMDGSSPLTFEKPIGDYFIVIRHRNHLAIMSAATVATDAAGALYDFTIAASQAYGFNPMIMLAPNVYGTRPGDCNNDGGVDALDRNFFWKMQNGQPFQYLNSADFNLDGGTDALDLNLYWRLMNGTATQVP